MNDPRRLAGDRGSEQDPAYNPLWAHARPDSGGRSASHAPGAPGHEAMAGAADRPLPPTSTGSHNRVTTAPDAGAFAQSRKSVWIRPIRESKARSKPQRASEACWPLGAAGRVNPQNQFRVNVRPQISRPEHSRACTKRAPAGTFLARRRAGGRRHGPPPAADRGEARSRRRRRARRGSDCAAS